MTGYWATFERILHIAPTPGDAQALTIEALEDGAWATSSDDFSLRADGLFHPGDNPAGYRLVHAGNRTFLVLTFTGHDGYSTTELLTYQKVGPRQSITDAWQRRAGGTWVVVNELSDSSTYDSTGPTLKVSSVPGLPGYVGVGVPMYGACQIHNASQDDDVAHMFLQIPGNYSRDLEDLVVEAHDGEEWMRWASSTYRPLAAVPALTSGTNVVAFGSEGYAEWRTLKAAAALHIASGSAWYLYDGSFTVLGGGTGAAADRGAGAPAGVAAPAGACLVLFGEAGSQATVTVSGG